METRRVEQSSPGLVSIRFDNEVWCRIQHNTKFMVGSRPSVERISEESIQVSEFHWDHSTGRRRMRPCKENSEVWFRQPQPKEASAEPPKNTTIPKCGRPTQPGMYICQRGSRSQPGLVRVEVNPDGLEIIGDGVGVFALDKLESDALFWGPICLQDGYAVSTDHLR